MLQADFEDGFAAALKRGQSVDFLLGLWRTQRLEELGVLLEAHDDVGEPRAAPLGVDDVDWSRREAFAQSLVLLRSLAGPALKKLLTFISQQPPDPRFGSALSKFYAERPTLLDAPMMKAAFCGALVVHADTRHLEVLEKVVAPSAIKFRKPTEALLRQLRALEAPSGAWFAARLAAMPKLQRGVSSEDELWARVYDAPGDLAIRAVLADALIERGDPRGAFIAAQLAGDATPPSAGLLPSLLGPLAPALRAGTVQFANGFPVSAMMNTSLSGAKQAAALMLREWGTLQSLDYLERLAPSLKALERASAVPSRALDAWIKGGWQIPLRVLSTEMASLERIARLPCALEVLAVTQLYLAADFDAGEVYRSLVEVRSLTTLCFSRPSFRTDTGWTSEELAPWPRWSDDALAVPSLRTIEWEAKVGRWRLSSERERFDTLSLSPRGAAPKLENFGTPARHVVIDRSMHPDDLA